MTVSENQPVRSTWLLWVIALVTLLGFNALVPECPSANASDSPDGIGISQLSDDAQTPGRNSNTPGLLPPHRSDAFGFPHPLSHYLRIEKPLGQVVPRSPGGEVQGRAPPMIRYC